MLDFNYRAMKESNLTKTLIDVLHDLEWSVNFYERNNTTFVWGNNLKEEEKEFVISFLKINGYQIEDLTWSIKIKWGESEKA